MFALQAAFQIREALVLGAALAVEAVDLGFGDGEVAQGIGEIVLGGIVVAMQTASLSLASRSFLARPMFWSMRS